MADLPTLLNLVARRHRHLCPRQVLGVRIGLAGAAALGLDAPRTDRRLVAIVETDGCFADGIEVATGATIGRRTLRVIDYGKVAATLVDVVAEAAVRVSPADGIRERARAYAPEEHRRYFAQMAGYQRMPEEELLLVRPVRLAIPISHLLGRAGVRVRCIVCGEEVINGREIRQEGLMLCRGCAGDRYYSGL